MNNEKQPLLGYQFRGLMIVGGTDLFMFTWLDLKWCYHITICFIFVRVGDFRSDSLDTVAWFWIYPSKFASIVRNLDAPYAVSIRQI